MSGDIELSGEDYAALAVQAVQLAADVGILKAENVRLTAERDGARLALTKWMLGECDTEIERENARLTKELAEEHGLVEMQLAEITRLKDVHEDEIRGLRKRMVAAESEMERVKPLWEQQLNAEREAHAQTRAELEAVRELMNTYNLGGWTDAVGPMQRALSAEAVLRGLRAWVETEQQQPRNRYEPTRLYASDVLAKLGELEASQ